MVSAAVRLYEDPGLNHDRTPSPPLAGHAAQLLLLLAKAQMLRLEDGSDLGEVHEALHGRRLRPQDYTTLITELRHARKWRLAVSVGDWLIEQPAKAGAEALPNLVHYNAMMRACAAAGQHEAAVHILDTVTHQQLRDEYQRQKPPATRRTAPSCSGSARYVRPEAQHSARIHDIGKDPVVHGSGCHIGLTYTYYTGYR